MGMSGLEIDEDVGFQRKLWVVERVCWVLIFGIVAAAMAGVFGGGVIGRAVGGGDGFQVEYDRFLRADNPTRITIRLDDISTFAISREYLSKMRDVTVLPWAQVVLYGKESVMYTFAGEMQETEVFLHFTPTFCGFLRGYVERGRDRVDFAQFVYP